MVCATTRRNGFRTARVVRHRAAPAAAPESRCWIAVRVGTACLYSRVATWGMPHYLRVGACAIYCMSEKDLTTYDSR